MKKLATLILLSVVSVALLAQTVAKVVEKSGRAPTQSVVELRVASGIGAAEAALAPAELALAERVYQGTLPCELGAFVNLTADPKSPGRFDLQIGKQKFRMTPVMTSTGAIRLEDSVVGVVWLQLGNKSMLMNQKLGQRMADECKSLDQVAVAEALIKNPAPSLLDAPVEITFK